MDDSLDSIELGVLLSERFKPINSEGGGVVGVIDDKDAVGDAATVGRVTSRETSPRSLLPRRGRVGLLIISRILDVS